MHNKDTRYSTVAGSSLARAEKTLADHSGTESAIRDGRRFRVGLTNLGGRVPVTPNAMKRYEFKTAKPATRTIPRKMLSKRPGSTTPTRRVGPCRPDHGDVKRMGESRVTSAWPTFSANTDAA